MSDKLKPQRIQRKCTKGWKMPDNTVYVGRPTKWGNPFKVNQAGTHDECVQFFSIDIGFMNSRLEFMFDEIGQLRGKNLACWCPLDRPCHADVLLELANCDT